MFALESQNQTQIVDFDDIHISGCAKFLEARKKSLTCRIFPKIFHLQRARGPSIADFRRRTEKSLIDEGDQGVLNALKIRGRKSHRDRAISKIRQEAVELLLERGRLRKLRLFSQREQNRKHRKAGIEQIVVFDRI